LSRGGPTSFTHSVVQGEQPNQAHVKGGVLRSDAAAASGQGSVVRLWLKPLKPGTVEVRALRIEPVAGDGCRPPMPPPVRTDIR
jgi:hypothetical protein